MSSPRSIDAGVPRAWRIAAGVMVAVLFSVLPGPAISSLADPPDELKQAKKELTEVRGRVQERLKKLKILQRRMNRLATQISRTESKLAEAERRIERLKSEMLALELRAAEIKADLDERGRTAYMLGGVNLMYVLTATSAADAASRVSLLSEMNRRGALLVAELQRIEERLSGVRAEIVRGAQVMELYRRSLEEDRRAMERKMALSRRLVARLRGRIEQIQTEISLIRPLAVCPVGGPHAIADNFGAPRPEPGGGFHWHQGDDIMAATGTPILAPFDGVATVSHSTLGGLAVYVHGEYGYVYNAHLSRLGSLGPVETGDVIGYVGSTGHSSGPHDHFEWHPTEIPPDWPESPYGRAVIGDAINPFPPLSQVC
jgi:murein DD-endopeptidase MepM/ murein hydrolase activator NlpD